MAEKYDIAIVGGGGVGLALGRELAESGKKVAIIEARDSLATEQSARNSGVIHCGLAYYFDHGSLKEKLSLEGNPMLYNFAEEHGIPVKKTGKFMVSLGGNDEQRLEDLLEVGRSAGVPGIERVTGEHIRSVEPNVDVKSGLWLPSNGVISVRELNEKLAQLYREAGGEVLTGTKVIGIEDTGSQVTLVLQNKTGQTELEASVVINAAGLYADKVAELHKPELAYPVRGLRGEYFTFNRTGRPELHYNGTNIYPLAELKVEESGTTFKRTTHLTPILDESGNVSDVVLVGPLFNPARSKDDYDQNRHPASDFVEELKLFQPNVQEDDLTQGLSGIMATIVRPDGKPERDFVFIRDGNVVHIQGMSSPGLTSFLSIAKYVRENYLH